MKLALPVWQDRVSPVLDTASHVLVIQYRRGVEVSRREVTLGVMSPVLLARSIAELGVGALICGALSEPLQRALEAAGVRVESHVCGEVSAVVEAFGCGRLRQDEFRMPGCWGHHHPGGVCRRKPLRRRAAVTNRRKEDYP